MNLFYQEPIATLYCGHALDLKELPAESVDMCMTSPPYWGLRSYKTEPMIWDSKDGCRHEWNEYNKRWHSGTNAGAIQLGDKGAFHNDFNNLSNFCSLCGAWRGELGLEPTIELYIKHLIQIFGEVKRVLKKTGTCWVNIDDSYASGKGTCFNPGGGKGSFSGHGDRKDSGIYPLDRGNISMLRAEGLLPKSLCLIPSRFALAMVESGWILRNDICWFKPNPMPESVKDRFTGSWEHLFFFVKSKRYWFEQQFEPMAYPERVFNPDTSAHATAQLRQEGNRTTGGLHDGRTQYGNPELGRNKRDAWEICTEASDYDYCLKCDNYFTGRRRSSIQVVTVDNKDKKKCPVCGSTEDWLGHFATFPEKLCETPILAGCPSMICKKCGRAREKVYKVVGYQITDAMRIAGCNEQGEYQGQDSADYRAGLAQSPSDSKRRILESMSEVKEFEYTDCGCNAGFESGVVLDPFCGSGTALAVAKKLGYKSIGIDISPDYCNLAVKRIQGISLPMELA